MRCSLSAFPGACLCMAAWLGAASLTGAADEISPPEFECRCTDGVMAIGGHADAGRSMLLHRLSIRGRGQMPQLASSVVDREAVNLLRRWIEEMDDALRP